VWPIYAQKWEFTYGWLGSHLPGLWQTRNAVCFEKKKIRSPVEIICLASSYLNYWAGLQKDEDKTSIEMGAEALKEAALLHHPQARPQQRSGRAVSGNGAVMLT
jgi:hypothetical protein